MALRMVSDGWWWPVVAFERRTRKGSLSRPWSNFRAEPFCARRPAKAPLAGWIFLSAPSQLILLFTLPPRHHLFQDTTINISPHGVSSLAACVSAASQGEPTLDYPLVSLSLPLQRSFYPSFVPFSHPQSHTRPFILMLVRSCTFWCGA